MSEQILQNRIRFVNNHYTSLTPEFMTKSAWVSTALALVFTIPALITFIGIYYYTENIVMGAIIGFSLHFVTLAFSTRISSVLEKLFD